MYTNAQNTRVSDKLFFRCLGFLGFGACGFSDARLAYQTSPIRNAQNQQTHLLFFFVSLDSHENYNNSKVMVLFKVTYIYICTRTHFGSSLLAQVAKAVYGLKLAQALLFRQTSLHRRFCCWAHVRVFVRVLSKGTGWRRRSW